MFWSLKAHNFVCIKRQFIHIVIVSPLYFYKAVCGIIQWGGESSAYLCELHQVGQDKFLKEEKKKKTGTWARGQMLQMFQVKKIFLSVFSVKIHRERGYNQSAVCVRESLDLRSGFVDSDKPLIAVWILNL